jgi:hypothetical protein
MRRRGEVARAAIDVERGGLAEMAHPWGTARFWTAFIGEALETGCLLGRRDSTLRIRDLCPAGFTAVTYRARACRESGAHFAPHHSGSRFLMRRIAVPIFPVSGMRLAIAARKEAADPHTEDPYGKRAISGYNGFTVSSDFLLIGLRKKAARSRTPRENARYS